MNELSMATMPGLLLVPRAAAIGRQTEIERLESYLCSCAAGQAEALHDAEHQAKARAVLARWQLVFPANDRLKGAAEHLGLGRYSS